MDLGALISGRNDFMNNSRQISLGGGVLGASGNSIVSSGSQYNKKQQENSFQMNIYTPDKY